MKSKQIGDNPNLNSNLKRKNLIYRGVSVSSDFFLIHQFIHPSWWILWIRLNVKFPVFYSTSALIKGVTWHWKQRAEVILTSLSMLSAGLELKDWKWFNVLQDNDLGIYRLFHTHMHTHWAEKFIHYKGIWCFAEHIHLLSHFLSHRFFFLHLQFSFWKFMLSFLLPSSFTLPVLFLL